MSAENEPVPAQPIEPDEPATPDTGGGNPPPKKPPTNTAE